MQLKDGHLFLSPSDVTGYLGCEHMTSLSVQVARGEIARPALENDQAELVFRKGREHEAAYLARLREGGKSVMEISLEPDFDWDRAAAETEAAIRSGVDVVYQGVLAGGRWRGQADFLERQADGTYEAVDTKLARHAKPAYILQLCFYSERLAAIQGVEPAWIHVMLGSGERQSFRPSEFAAYASSPACAPTQCRRSPRGRQPPRSRPQERSRRERHRPSSVLFSSGHPPMSDVDGRGPHRVCIPRSHPRRRYGERRRRATAIAGLSPIRYGASTTQVAVVARGLGLLRQHRPHKPPVP
ncbi:MAG: hypothetical protein ACXVRK_03565 [Gaiellaceae bacterium]